MFLLFSIFCDLLVKSLLSNFVAQSFVVKFMFPKRQFIFFSYIIITRTLDKTLGIILIIIIIIKKINNHNHNHNNKNELRPQGGD